MGGEHIEAADPDDASGEFWWGKTGYRRRSHVRNRGQSSVEDSSHGRGRAPLNVRAEGSQRMGDRQVSGVKYSSDSASPHN